MWIKTSHEYAYAECKTSSEFQADQICYSVLCVFSYVAAGTDKSSAPKKPAPVNLAQLPISCLRPAVSPQEPSQNVKQIPCPMPSNTLPPPTSPEPGSITPVGGPPCYPPPALPPTARPPAPPPSLKTQTSTTGKPSQPPPVPSRSTPTRQVSATATTQAPQPPPRPKWRSGRYSLPFIYDESSCIVPSCLPWY